MRSRILRLAIISDLHCHPKRKPEEGNDQTYLLTDKLRSSSKDHPVSDLLSLIKREGLEADLTMCPGDFTDQASVQGFISGWGFSLEIHRELKSREIIATLGNHDVDVYNLNSNYSLDIAKGIKRGFPLANDSECNVFWSKGCVILERDECRILVINSSHFHHNKASAKSGSVSDDLIDYIEEHLDKNNDDKIKIAMSHHHPIDHSRLKLGEEDKIFNAEELLNTLGKYKFDLFIHGHKHDPLLRYHTSTSSGHQIPILASGSFSSFSNLMFASVRNAFHLVTLKKEGGICKGEIKTWTFFPNSGWSQPEDESGFPAFTGFGSKKKPETLINDIEMLMNGQGKITWEDLISHEPDLMYLLPNEGEILEKMLRSKNFLFDKAIKAKPSQLYNVSRL